MEQTATNSPFRKTLMEVSLMTMDFWSRFLVPEVWNEQQTIPMILKE
jgi:hypothetical protein